MTEPQKDKKPFLLKIYRFPTVLGSAIFILFMVISPKTGHLPPLALICAGISLLFMLFGHMTMSTIHAHREKNRKSFSFDNTVIPEVWNFCWVTALTCAAVLLTTWAILAITLVNPESPIWQGSTGKGFFSMMPFGLFMAFFGIPGLFFLEKVESMLLHKLQQSKKNEPVAQKAEVSETLNVIEKARQNGRKLGLPEIQKTLLKSNSPQIPLEHEYKPALLLNYFFRFNLTVVLAYIALSLFFMISSGGIE